MSDAACTCQANHAAAVDTGALVANAAPVVTEPDPAVVERLVEAFTAAAADTADTRIQDLEARFAELEQVVATLLSEWAQSTMQDMPV